MNSNHLMTASAFFFTSLAFAGTAHAERNPTPPPSGIVIHLFGPHSVMSNVMPGLPGETAQPAQGQTAQTAHPAANATSFSATSPNTTSPDAASAAASGAENSVSASPASSNAPTWHDVFHQMFVTGDPNDPNKPAPGRPSERPGAQ